MPTQKDTFSDRFKSLRDDLKAYIETRLELMVLESGERFSNQLSDSIQRITGFVLLSIGGVFALIALSIYLGELLGYAWAGYVIVAAPLLLIGLFFVNRRPRFFSRNMKRRVMERFLLLLPASKVGTSEGQGAHQSRESEGKDRKSNNPATSKSKKTV